MVPCGAVWCRVLTLAAACRSSVVHAVLLLLFVVLMSATIVWFPAESILEPVARRLASVMLPGVAPRLSQEVREGACGQAPGLRDAAWRGAAPATGGEREPVARCLASVMLPGRAASGG